ncbi:MAG: DDE-type integrase/transposase/recombinase [Erysipelotrichales bacterium]|nr:DDE-type integrase/transposase/recombinase [Erysipelotrichales bacterium]
MLVSLEKRKFNNPYDPKEKLKALNMLKRNSFEFVAHRYHCTIRTLYRWRKQYDGTLESLENGSHVPLTPNPREQTSEEKKHIQDLVRRNPNIGLSELYGKLRVNYGYSRNPVTLYRYLRKNNYFKDLKKDRKNYKPQKYFTPISIGEKMQLDVKVVPYDCRTKDVPFDMKFYQYTIIDEATRERFIYPYKEQCADSTCDFVRRAINYFGYTPKIIQTDNGQEFTFLKEIGKVHKFDLLCEELGIEHKLIKPRTPRHNGKVERSHRNDNERFYKYLKFYSYDDLLHQMKAYLKRSNNIPSFTLGWKTPIEKRKERMLIDFGVVE